MSDELFPQPLASGARGEVNLKAISLWQPFASLVGIGKSFETRSWSTNYRGPIAIHAAKRWTGEQASFSFTEPCHDTLLFQGRFSWYHGIWTNMPLGAIVAVAELKGCIPTEDVHVIGREWHPACLWISETEAAFGDYSPGRFAWILNNIRILREPIPYTGRQGLFNVDAETISRINAERNHAKKEAKNE